MLTRRDVKTWLLRIGMTLGIIGVCVYILTPFAALRYEGPIYSAQIGRGAVALFWQSMPRFQQSPAMAPALNTGQPFMPTPFERTFSTDGRRIPLYFKPTIIDISDTQRSGRIILPAWILVLIGAVCLYLRLPLEIAPGTCPFCRFDISRAPPLPDAPSRTRCPECGRTSRRRQPNEKSGAKAPPDSEV